MTTIAEVQAALREESRQVAGISNTTMRLGDASLKMMRDNASQLREVLSDLHGIPNQMRVSAEAASASGDMVREELHGSAASVEATGAGSTTDTYRTLAGRLREIGDDAVIGGRTAHYAEQWALAGNLLSQAADMLGALSAELTVEVQDAMIRRRQVSTVSLDIRDAADAL